MYEVSLICRDVFEAAKPASGALKAGSLRSSTLIENAHLRHDTEE
jgi:hypothetical protein